MYTISSLLLPLTVILSAVNIASLLCVPVIVGSSTLSSPTSIDDKSYVVIPSSTFGVIIFFLSGFAVVSPNKSSSTFSPAESLSNIGASITSTLSISSPSSL